MRASYTSATCIGFIILLFAETSSGKEWRGIVPLQSTRQDVLRILGPSEKPGDLYNLRDEVVLIRYSQGTCKQGGIWNVTRDTVQAISIKPRKAVAITALGLKLSEYEIVVDETFPGIVYYNNSEEGIHIQIYQNDVTSIDYLPEAKDNHLRCNAPPSGPVSQAGAVIDSHHLFDDYGELSFDKEREHLGFLGRKLRENAEAHGYIVAYNGPGWTVKRALARANRAKRYLIKVYGLRDDRIEIVKGGRRQEFTIQLYFVPSVPDKSLKNGVTSR